ncbi:MAG: hypothetical protein JXM70_26060 [Pirellulales bacterium]|nr:hypothetical protein [Pirellulales bacterium]
MNCSLKSAACCLCLLLPIAVACSKGGPLRYQVSGKVTYKGQPVPAGRILFQPDESKGNNGPPAAAAIREGRYQTPPELSPVGGPHIVTISGNAAKPVDQANSEAPDNIPFGRSLFLPYKTNADLPKEPTTLDFEVLVR